MITRIIKAKQTIYDIALECYGTAEAIGEILALNPCITNDAMALIARGIDPAIDPGFYLDVAVATDTEITINEQSALRLPMTIKQMNDIISTYDYGTDD